MRGERSFHPSTALVGLPRTAVARAEGVIRMVETEKIVDFAVNSPTTNDRCKHVENLGL